jgi:hypothetical protein
MQTGWPDSPERNEIENRHYWLGNGAVAFVRAGTHHFGLVYRQFSEHRGLVNIAVARRLRDSGQR